MRSWKKNRYLTLGLILTGFIALLSVLSWFWTPYSPTAMVGSELLSAPSLRHIFGTDNFGRDIFSRVMTGVGATFAIALCTVVLGAAIGTVVGAVTGYFGGWVDQVLMRFSDAFTAFPSVLLALVFISLFGPSGLSLFSDSRWNMILSLALVFVPSYIRIVRSEFARIREMNYIKSAHLMGASAARIMFAHILPNTLCVLFPALTIGFNNAVLAEVSMSFLGIGVRPPQASLGYMLAESQSCLSSAPWYAISTGCMAALLTLGVGLISEGLQRKKEVR